MQGEVVAVIGLHAGQEGQQPIRAGGTGAAEVHRKREHLAVVEGGGDRLGFGVDYGGGALDGHLFVQLADFEDDVDAQRLAGVQREPRLAETS